MQMHWCSLAPPATWLTVLWTDKSQARVLTSSAEIRALIESGELEEFNGVPESHPEGFVVNCLAPILAPNTLQPDSELAKCVGIHKQ